MRQSEEFARAEALRLENCIKEPIRTPNAIQAHGVFFALDRVTLDIVFASRNSERMLGVDAVGVLGHPISAIVGDVTSAALAAFAQRQDEVSEHIPVTVNEVDFDLALTTSDEYLFAEFEHAVPDGEPTSVSALYAAMAHLGRITVKEKLWSETAIVLRRLLGFDKVMVYHFHSDDHGEVVAEDRADDMESYQGLHYPASDIPAQARNLYLTKLSRVIGDSSLDGVELVSADGATLDLSRAELRSVSPHHREFMRNMGQASTYSLSLVRNGRLIGMITSAHRTPRTLPFAVRRALEALANQVAMQLGTMDDIARLERIGHFRSIRDQLIGRVSSSGDLRDSLFHGEVTALSLIDADGVALWIDGSMSTLGTVPREADIVRFASSVLSGEDGSTFCSVSLLRDSPEFSAAMRPMAGAIVAPIGSSGDFIAWFRHEEAQSINWLGDQSRANRASELSPRTSFSAWTQSVSDQSAAWDGLEIEAGQLAREIERAVARRVESHLAMHDPLTGLPNRRRLMDRIEAALAARDHGVDVSLLFIDLDGFKQVNDTYGHHAGDLVLVHTAQQLRAATRQEDTVARLGGDEFVILCGATTADEADVLAERIADSLRTPIDVDGTLLAVRASIGTVAANSSYSAPELLREADAAMYRAKLSGRDRSSR